MKTLAIGTVIHATHRPEDLAPAFLDALKAVDKKQWRESLEELPNQLDDLTEFVDELQDTLTEYCPPYCYFGTTEGDGSDFGCWPDLHRVIEELAEGSDDLTRLEDMPKGYTGFSVDVNDHGNTTLYKVTNGRKREVWAVV